MPLSNNNTLNLDLYCDARKRQIVILGSPFIIDESQLKPADRILAAQILERSRGGSRRETVLGQQDERILDAAQRALPDCDVETLTNLSAEKLALAVQYATKNLRERN